MEDMLGMQMQPPICLRTFLNEYKELLHCDLPQPKTDEDIQRKMNLLDDSKTFDSIEDSCDLNQILEFDDAPSFKFEPGFTEMYRKSTCSITASELGLKTFNKLIEVKNTNSRQQKNPFRRSREVFRLAPIPARTEDANDLKKIADMYNDVIISIRVYRPARSTHIGRTLEKPVFAEEFQCLGSNFLTELRDKINCKCNGKHFFDISDNPHAPMHEKTIDPGYFFITDTFYNDHRNSGNLDYSETIRNWAKRANGLKNLNFKVARMEETRFIDLTVSIGFPQLYQHHGNCEHVFVFSQVELFTPAVECVQRNEYPRLASFGAFNNRVCNMCGVSSYVYIVENSERQLHDPAYLCKKCFYSYNYVDGKKIGEFRAYRLLDIVDDSEKFEQTTEDDNELSETDVDKRN